jgi:hypothetical protein
MSKEKWCRKACERHDASWHTELAGLLCTVLMLGSC